MKKFFSFLSIFLIFLGVLFGLYYYLFLFNNCHLPISYSVGQVDSRFKISQSDVLASAQGAAQRWNNQTGNDLLKYDPQATLKINLIYDSRQEEIDKVNSQIQNLTQSKEQIENYQENYEKLLSQYQNDLNSYNNEVSYWNARAGAPANTYQKLQQEKQSLDSRRQDLINLAKNLNFQAQNYNENLSDFQNDISRRKNLIITQGTYDPTSNTINIYTFGNTDELRLVLMHEFGHTLGLSHAQNPVSIMYELLDQQDLKNPTLTDEDKNLLELKCHRLKFYLTQ